MPAAPLPPVKARLNLDVDGFILDRLPDGPAVRRWLANQDDPPAPTAPPGHVLMRVVAEGAHRQLDEALNAFLNHVPPGATVSVTKTQDGIHVSTDGGKPSLTISIDIDRR